MFLPTGGISEENLEEFLKIKNIFACGGSWMMRGIIEEIKEKYLRASKIVKESCKK